MTALTWSPTIEFVRQTIADEGQLRLIIAPFIKIDALRDLVDECDDTSQLQVVVRWTRRDLVAGVSDVEIYPYLKERKIALFRHPSIHLKLLVYNQSLAFHTSSNVTRKGLGLALQSNVEIGCPVTLEPGDWINLRGLLSTSQEVDDHMYEQARKYVQENKKPLGGLPPLTLTPAKEKQFSRDALPASESPELLYRFYSGELATDQLLDESPEFVHDLMLYSIPNGLSEADFFSKLEDAFRAQPFIMSLVQFIRESRSARFGAVNAWITENCSDSPRPYRRDLKTTTRHLYNWLSYFYDEITWNTPNYSMVIYWKEG